MKDYSAMTDGEINDLVISHIYKDKELSPDVDYCNDPESAWPIIVENEISIIFEDVCWKAIHGLSMDSGGLCDWAGCYNDVNPLRAAMIVFLMMKGSE